MVKSAKRKETVVTSSDVNMDMFNGRRVTRSMEREFKATGLKKDTTQKKYEKISKFALVNNLEKEKIKAKKLRKQKKEQKEMISKLKDERFNMIAEQAMLHVQAAFTLLEKLEDETEILKLQNLMSREYYKCNSLRLDNYES